MALWSLCCIPLMALGTVLYFAFQYRGKKAVSLFWKSFASGMMVLLCGAGLVMGGKSPWESLLFWGLAACCVADCVLELHFVSGMAAFGAAHVLFIVWIVQQGRPVWYSIPIWVVLYGSTAFLYRKIIPTLGKNLVPFMLYPAVLMAMASLALVLPFTAGKQYWTAAVGALVFAISDLLVAKGVLVGNSRACQHFTLALYDVALAGLALAGFFSQMSFPN